MSGSTLVINESFDDSPNWENPFSDAYCSRGLKAECADAPEQWPLFYSSERWHPAAGIGSAHPSMQISGEQFRGGMGKSFIVWDESFGSPGQWGSNATLARDLGTQMRDVYAEFYIKFEPGYRWHHVEAGGGTNLAKIYRLTHFDGAPGSPFDFFSDGDSAPGYFLDTNVWTFARNGATENRAYISSSLRCDPQESNYRCTGFEENNNDALGNRSFEETFGDGNWHKIGSRVRMNSAPGATDGLVEVWFDDVLVGRHEGIPFLGSSAPASNGWNMVMLGGNVHNYPEPESARLEQWFAIDDFRLYRLD